MTETLPRPRPVPRRRARGSRPFWLAQVLPGLDCPASSMQTQEGLGWRPTQSGLISDLYHARYFEA
jgi:hypothetical protein